MKARQKVTKPPFLRARSSKAAKRKLKTQAARAETCKRRLFVDEEENQPVPILPEPHVLRERIQPELPVKNCQPIELSGVRIIDVGLLQQSLKCCEYCKSGKYV
ncbi:hypothetical protein OS493_008047 [Desmophyllum pertusum]|uniref:Uncharacterized protein n=1 Tax=Desmophyllum pertusum TaxID=174260 RepID=A0A9W9YIC6_9CNID|nr:hypothetical protein OS493_008047 [Desmophyllum pertusum]